MREKKKREGTETDSGKEEKRGSRSNGANGAIPHCVVSWCGSRHRDLGPEGAGMRTVVPPGNWLPLYLYQARRRHLVATTVQSS